jgi:gas vesicle protein
MARNNVLNLVLAFTIGGVVGAGVALLFAPQSGEKTRRKIREAVEDVREDIMDYADRLKEKIT